VACKKPKNTDITLKPVTFWEVEAYDIHDAVLIRPYHRYGWAW
jgi:hypothetical protein